MSCSTVALAACRDELGVCEILVSLRFFGPASVEGAGLGPEFLHPQAS